MKIDRKRRKCRKCKIATFLVNIAILAFFGISRKHAYQMPTRFQIFNDFPSVTLIRYSRARGSGDIRADKQTNRRTNFRQIEYQENCPHFCDSYFLKHAISSLSSFLDTHSHTSAPYHTFQVVISTVVLLVEFSKKRFKMKGIVINRVFLISVTISMVLANHPELGKHCQQNVRVFFDCSLSAQNQGLAVRIPDCFVVL